MYRCLSTPTVPFRWSAARVAAHGALVVIPLLAVAVVANAERADKAPPADKAAPADKAPPADKAAPGGIEQPVAAKAKPAPPVVNRGVLPSELDDPAGIDQPVKPQEILSDYGLGAQRLDGLVDGDPILDSEAERELLLRIVMRMRRIPIYNIEYWADQQDERNIEMKTLLEQPDRFRGHAFRAKGRVVMMERVDIPNALRQRFETDQLYRCHLYVGWPEVAAVVYTPAVPKGLIVGEALDDRISFYGLFLKRGYGSVGIAPMVFVSPRLASHNNTLLGDLDMDTSLLDDVQNGSPLQQKEHECFYQMLQAARNAGAGELVRHAYNDVVDRVRKMSKEKRGIESKLKRPADAAPSSSPPSNAKELAELQHAHRLLEAQLRNSSKHAVHPFVPLMETPAEFNGQLRMFRGTAHRIVKVRIDEPSVKQRFGITHYYQIDMLVNLEHKIKLVTPAPPGTADEPVEKTTWRHPAVFCALNLPEGMPLGDNLHEPIRVAGFVFKIWTYQAEDLKVDKVTQDLKAMSRSAPMLIGREPKWDQQPPSGAKVYMGAIAGGLFALALAGIWIGVWRISRSDDAFHNIARSKAYGVEDGTSLNDLDLETASVDFSYLANVELPAEPPETPSPDAVPQQPDLP